MRIKILSGIFLIIGAIVGGGIIAIPIASAQFGFMITLLLITSVWLLMTKTGLFILSLSLEYPEKYNSYYTIVDKRLGKNIRKVVSFLYLWLLFFSLSGYLSGGASLLIGHFFSSYSFTTYFQSSLFFLFIFGGVVIISSKIVIRANMLLVLAKLSLLLMVIFSSLYFYPLQINSSLLHFSLRELNMHSGNFLTLLLIIINAFGFHFIIPSLVTYYGKERSIPYEKILIFSTTIVFLLYIAWLYTIYMLIPLEGKHGLLAIYKSSNQLLALNIALKSYQHSAFISNVLSVFSIIALASSFFCVSLGLFDFLYDALKAKNRLFIGVLTFTPPLLFSLLSQNMYMYAMSMSGYIAVVLEIIIPLWAVYTTPKLKQIELSN